MASHNHVPAPRDTIEMYSARPEREPPRNENGEIICQHAACRDKNEVFRRPCEWNKHMDKHERPYKCNEPTCEQNPGFTYSGGLLRHMREVHKKGVGPTRRPLYCPHANCIRSIGEGFTRRENLEDHLRRRHSYTGHYSPPPQSTSSQDEEGRFRPSRHHKVHEPESPSVQNGQSARFADRIDAITQGILRQLTLARQTIAEQQESIRSKALLVSLLAQEATQKPTHYPQYSCRSYLPIRVDGKAEMAIPDSGSVYNVISEDWADANGIHVDRDVSRRHDLRTATGSIVTSVGEARLTVSFQDGVATASNELFLVMPGCTFSLVIGNAFLRACHVFTRYKHLLVKMTKQSWRLLQMSTLTDRVVCKVGDTTSQAVVDTGSEKSFVSPDYARRNGWNVNRLKYLQYVELADGTLVRIQGFVEKQFRIEEFTRTNTFYVLPGLECDVLLGHEFIDEIDLYNLVERRGWSKYWTDDHDGSENERPEFFAIDWLDHIDEQITNFSTDPAYSVPAETLAYLQASSGSTTSGITSRRDKWWKRNQPPRPESRARQYDILQSGLWQRLSKIDRDESEAKKRSQTALSTAMGTDLTRLTDEETVRKQKYRDERERIKNLRQGLLDWREANPNL